MIFHTEVRWLSRGKVSCRFIELKNELVIFFQNEGMDDFVKCLQNDDWYAKEITLIQAFKAKAKNCWHPLTNWQVSEKNNFLEKSNNRITSWYVSFTKCKHFRGNYFSNNWTFNAIGRKGCTLFSFLKYRNLWLDMKSICYDWYIVTWIFIRRRRTSLIVDGSYFKNIIFWNDHGGLLDICPRGISTSLYEGSENLVTIFNMVSQQ